jgi:hypothetical protein
VSEVKQHVNQVKQHVASDLDDDQWVQKMHNHGKAHIHLPYEMPSLDCMGKREGKNHNTAGLIGKWKEATYSGHGFFFSKKTASASKSDLS